MRIGSVASAIDETAADSAGGGVHIAPRFVVVRPRPVRAGLSVRHDIGPLAGGVTPDAMRTRVRTSTGEGAATAVSSAAVAASATRIGLMRGEQQCGCDYRGHVKHPRHVSLP